MVSIVNQASAWLQFIYTWDLIFDRCESVYIRDRDRLRQIQDYYNTKAHLMKKCIRAWPDCKPLVVRQVIPWLPLCCFCCLSSSKWRRSVCQNRFQYLHSIFFWLIFYYFKKFWEICQFLEWRLLLFLINFNYILKYYGFLK